jgi:Lipopolysaccharide-assembly
MILMNKYKLRVMSYGLRVIRKGVAIPAAYSWLLAALLFSSCYTFKDISIPPEVKTVKVNFFENKARIINPQLSQKLTDRLRQKVVGQTRLSQTNSDEAHYDVSGYISDYNVSTSGISQGSGGRSQSSINRLNVSVHLVFKNRLDETKNFEADLSRNVDFPATQSLSQAEASITDDIVKNLVDEIFNRIFSNW